MVAGNALWATALYVGYDDLKEYMNFDYFVLIFLFATAISDVLFIKPKNMKYCYKSVGTKDDDSSDDEQKDGYQRAPEGEII